MRAFIIFSLVFSLTFITYMKFNNYYPFKKFHKTNEDKGAGINGALFQDISKSVIQVFYPEIQQFITDINLPDQEFDVDIITVSLSNIHFGITNFQVESVNCEFVSPDIIRIHIKDIKGWGKFSAKFKWAFISLSEDVEFDLYDFDINCDVKLLSKVREGKILPDALLENINYNIDFDFTLHGDLSEILNLVKGPIKSVILDQLDNFIINESNEALQQGLSLIPLDIDINIEKGYAIDYTLIETPSISPEGNFLLFNSYGKFINKNIPDTKEDRYPLPKDIPKYNITGKKAQFYVTDYVINSALYTFYRTGDLKYTVSPEILPQDFPINLTTSFLDKILFFGIEEIYGKDIPCDITFEVNEEPLVNLDEKIMKFNVPTKITVDVRGFNDSAIIFTNMVEVKAELRLLEDVNITGYIYELSISQTNITYNNLPKVTEEIIENEFGYISELIKPFLNLYILKNLHFEIPSVKGMKFTNMTLSHNIKYIEGNYNFEFEEPTYLTSKPNKNIIELKFDCPKGKILKDIELIKEKSSDYYYYKYICINKKYLDY